MVTGSDFLDRVSTSIARRGLGRRGFLHRMTMAATALVVAPTTYLFRPVSALAAICTCSGQSCDCGSLCCDGYTEFCCTMYGANGCPTGTVPAGWWKADGSGLCDTAAGPQPRYYLDCNVAECGGCGCGSGGVCSGSCQTATSYTCGCGSGDCNNRKSGCTQFRYGQCHQELACVGPIVCRVVTCTPPWIWDGSCTTASATDNNTRFHNRPCLAGASVSLPPGVPVAGDWFGTGRSTVGVFGGGTWTVFRPDGSLYSFAFGDTGDLPVVGDWNGDGTETAGVYRRGRFYLRNSNTTGQADIVFDFGIPGDIPVAGDWNGDGVDTVGVYRQGQFFFRNSNSTGSGEFTFLYGIPGDIPVAGDWNGDGVDTVGVYRQGQFFFRNSNTTGVGDFSFFFGNPGDVPVAGDWNADGVGTVGIYRGGRFYLTNSNSTGVADYVI